MTIQSTAIPRPMPATTSPRSPNIPTADRADAHAAIDFKPGQLLGSVSGELGLRKFLEKAGHTLVVTSSKDGTDSVLDKELADAEIVISQPFWPAYMTKERIEKAKKLKLDHHRRHRLGPHRPSGRHGQGRHGRRGDLLQLASAWPSTSS